jgi:hypothetical protein
LLCLVRLNRVFSVPDVVSGGRRSRIEKPKHELVRLPREVAWCFEA